MWEFQDFSVTHILREIKIDGSGVSKSVFFTHSEALKLDFHAILHLFKSEIDQIDKIQSLKMAKSALLELLNSPKLISRKI